MQDVLRLPAAKPFKPFLVCAAVIVAGCGSITPADDPRISPSQTAEFSPVRAFAGRCAFVEEEREVEKAAPIVGALIAALAEPFVKVFIGTVKGAVKSAAAPETTPIAASVSFYAGSFDDSTKPFPRCFQLVSGVFAETRNSYEKNKSKAIEFIEATFPAEALAPEPDVSKPAKISSSTIEAALSSNGMYLAGVPALFLELYLMNAPEGDPITFSVTMISYREVLGTRRFGFVDDGNGRDLVVTLHIGGPGEGAANANGQPASVALINLQPGTIQRLDPGVIGSKWFRIQANSLPAARVAEINVVETRDGNEFLQKVSEVLEGISPASEQRLVGAAVELIDPEARAKAEKERREVSATDRRAFNDEIVALYSLRNAADQKIKVALSQDGTPFEKRQAAIAALGDMLKANIEAQRLGQPRLAYREDQLRLVEAAAAPE